jgi:hypothetical protein
MKVLRFFLRKVGIFSYLLTSCTATVWYILLLMKKNVFVAQIDHPYGPIHDEIRVIS